jgi:hypothetical protein
MIGNTWLTMKTARFIEQLAFLMVAQSSVETVGMSNSSWPETGYVDFRPGAFRQDWARALVPTFF